MRDYPRLHLDIDSSKGTLPLLLFYISQYRCNKDQKIQAITLNELKKTKISVASLLEAKHFNINIPVKDNNPFCIPMEVRNVLT